MANPDVVPFRRKSQEPEEKPIRIDDYGGWGLVSIVAVIEPSQHNGANYVTPTEDPKKPLYFKHLDLQKGTFDSRERQAYIARGVVDFVPEAAWRGKMRGALRVTKPVLERCGYDL